MVVKGSCCMWSPAGTCLSVAGACNVQSHYIHKWHHAVSWWPGDTLQRSAIRRRFFKSRRNGWLRTWRYPGGTNAISWAFEGRVTGGGTGWGQRSWEGSSAEKALWVLADSNSLSTRLTSYHITRRIASRLRQVIILPDYWPLIALHLEACGAGKLLMNSSKVSGGHHDRHLFC